MEWYLDFCTYIWVGNEYFVVKEVCQNMIICAFTNENFCTGILTLSCDHGIYHGPLAIRPKSHDQGIQMSPIYTYKAGRSCSQLPYVWQGSPNKLIKYIARWWWELLQHNMFMGWKRWKMHHIFKIYCCCWKSLHLLGLWLLGCSFG